MKKFIKYKGFTLLEILLVVALVGILAGIVLVSINPNRQLAQSRNLQRKIDIDNIYNAIEQYTVKNKGVLPSSITSNYTEICYTSNLKVTDSLPSTDYCNGRLDLRFLVPTYLKEIPKDNTVNPVNYTGYDLAKTSNNQITIRSNGAELNQIIIIN